MSTSDVIAGIALVVSIGALAAAAISLVLQFRESHRRDEELELLRRQLALLRQQVDAEQRAQLEVFAGVPGQRRGGGIEYKVPVQNVGDSVASQIAVELVDSGGVKVGESTLIVQLVPGEKGYATVLTPSLFAGPYEVFFEWDDGRSQRNRVASGLQVGEP